jgi:DNA-binding transcriptional MerR regulator
MNIKRAAEASGLEADTIRYYERSGVLPVPPRRPNGYRDYSQEHLATLQLVRGLRHLGLSLDEMRRIAAVAHDATCGELRSALIEEMEDVADETARRIRELELTLTHVQRLLAGLRRMRPRERLVPGATPCRCVTLVGSEVGE